MTNESRFDWKNRYLRPFTVLCLKLLIQAGFAVSAYFLFGLIKGINGFLTGFTAVLLAVCGFAILCPLYFGGVLFFTRRSFYGASRVGVLFSFFKSEKYGKALRYGLVWLIFQGLSFAVFFLPGLSLLVLLCYNVFKGASVFTVTVTFAAFLLLTGSGLGAFWRLKKLAYLSEYLFVLCPDGSPLEKMEESAFLMKNRTSAVTALRFGNFFRVLLCFAVIPAGFVWKSCQQRKADLARELFNKEK